MLSISIQTKSKMKRRKRKVVNKMTVSIRHNKMTKSPLLLIDSRKWFCLAVKREGLHFTTFKRKKRLVLSLTKRLESKLWVFSNHTVRFQILKSISTMCYLMAIFTLLRKPNTRFSKFTIKGRSSVDRVFWMLTWFWYKTTSAWG